jgi:membrane-associated phospholipid phosphatase
MLIRQNLYFFLPYLLILLVMGILQLDFSQISLLMTVNGVHHKWADIFFSFITHLGEGWGFALVAIFLALYQKKWFVMVSFADAFASIIAQILKQKVFYEMHRPSHTLPKIFPYFHQVDGVELAEYHSFPSGHTNSAFVIMLVLTLALRQKSYGLLCFVLACLVGYSRMYLFQHYPCDVYFGSLLGVSCTLAVYAALQRWLHA